MSRSPQIGLCQFPGRYLASLQALFLLLHLAIAMLANLALSTEDCVSINCLNGASCVQSASRPASCLCLLGYTGQLCESEIVCSAARVPLRGNVTYSAPARFVDPASNVMQYAFKTEARYSCENGFAVPSVDILSVCSSSGKWDPLPPSECQFSCNASSCPSAEDKNPTFNSCCSLLNRPIGCCRSVTKTLFEDRFKGLDAQCADDLFKLLVPCEDRLPQCYESLFTYNYTCPDLHGCNSRVPDPEKSASHLVCPPIAGPGAELCDSSCEGFYCLSKEFYCLPKSCISSQALLQIAVSDTNINCDLEKIFLGVTTCSGTTVNVKCHGNCTDASCPSVLSPSRTRCCTIRGKPVGCCTPSIDVLLKNRFRYISGECSANLGRQLEPCGNRLVQCLINPTGYNFSCPDSHGCLVSKESPSHCQQFVGPGAKWCTSVRCSAKGCLTSSFCMSSACQVLDQRYALARSDALLKCNGDTLYSETNCPGANSTITCSGDATVVQASTTDGCEDTLADVPSSLCPSQNKTCCQVGSRKLGCCSSLTAATISGIFSGITEPSCQSSLTDMLVASGGSLISALEAGPSASSPLPTFGPSTNTTSAAAECDALIGAYSTKCRMVVDTHTGMPSLILAFCLPTTCDDVNTIKEVATSEINFRCNLTAQVPCPLLSATVECKGSNGTLLTVMINDMDSSSETNVVYVGVAIACGLGLALIVIAAAHLLRKVKVFRVNVGDDRTELTDT